MRDRVLGDQIVRTYPTPSIDMMVAWGVLEGCGCFHLPSDLLRDRPCHQPPQDVSNDNPADPSSLPPSLPPSLPQALLKAVMARAEWPPGTCLHREQTGDPESPFVFQNWRGGQVSMPEGPCRSSTHFSNMSRTRLGPNKMPLQRPLAEEVAWIC